MIEAGGLVKRFGRRDGFVALDHVSFDVGKGEVFGVLGADGAGKTTLLRILASLTRPTEGWATIAGHSVEDHGRIGDLVGYAPQAPPLPRNMTVGTFLDFWGRVDGWGKAARAARIEALLESFQLTERTSQRVIECTTYEQRRAFLALSLLADPEVVLIDEPMVGLAPAEQQALIERFRALRDGGKTLVISSTKLAVLRQICGRIMALNEGRATRAYETSTLLKAVGDARHARVFVEAEAPGPRVLPVLRELPGVLEVRETSPAITLFVHPGEFERARAESALAQAGISVRSLHEAEVVINDVIRTLLRREAA